MIIIVNAVLIQLYSPSNVGVYQLAHYRCVVNDTGLSIIWLVNGTASNNSDIIQLGIVTIGAGSSDSSLTIPGYPQYNNTVVRCVAFEFVNGSKDFAAIETTLRLQGNTLSDICHYISSH